MKDKLAGPPPPDLLEGNRLFAGIPSELVSEIGSTLDVFRYDAGEIIFQEGDPGDCLFLVCDGSVRISKIGRGSQQETLGFIQPGNFFGEMALIDGQARSAQATANTATTLARVDHASFERILAKAPGSMHMNFLRSVVERLRGLNSHFIAELTRNERLSTVGSMANSIIHDLKNPIQIIRSCAEFISDRNSDPTVARFTQLMNKAVGGMLDMIQELLDFARGQSTVEPVVARATQVMSDLDEQLIRMIPANVHIEREIKCDASVMVDVSRFARVLLNLVKNAIEAMPKGGILSLSVLGQDDAVVFRIGDTGCGIPEELLPAIFEPFVTHGKSKGTGLGLAIVKSVVEAHHGTITVASKPGEGTTFSIRLPIARG